MRKRSKKNFNSPPSIAVGTLRVHPRGFGFLVPDDRAAFPEDVFVPKNRTKGAVDGDRVEVEVKTWDVSEKGPEGRVGRILRRGRSHVAGTIVDVLDRGGAYAQVPLLGTEGEMRIVPTDERKLEVGDRIIIHVQDWGSERREASGEMSGYIGHISDPSVDVQAAIEEYELSDAFSSEVLEEAKAYGTEVTAKEIKGREDFRSEVCITIDPETAKDFDDALSLTKDQNGYHLGVHIADVSHYVRPGSGLDEEARERCNSVYFPGHVLPMLPHELSSHLCSLKPDVDRLAASVLIDFDLTGGVQNYRIVRSVIRSQKRFSYEEAKEVLDGKKASPHKKLLKLMQELCFRLKEKRTERGCIEFALPDIQLRMDKKGMPQKVEVVEYDITHQMVEEFMLKANEIVATHLSEQSKPLTYRVHEEPNPENMKEFVQLANTYGYALTVPPEAKDLQALFDEARERPYGQFLATAFIRSMRLATYSTQNIGHYGLGLEHYTHFTSPIRRYVDLIVHRLLFDEVRGNGDLEQLATLCSEKERLSARAENSVTLLKKLRLLNEQVNQDPDRVYTAIVTQINRQGVSFDVEEFLLDGFVHISQFDDDFYVFDDETRSFTGEKGGHVFATGQRIEVMVDYINFIPLEAKWCIVLEE